MIVVAVDPGLGTGVARYTDGQFSSDEYDRAALAAVLPRMIERATHVCCERYVITEKTSKYTQQTDALNVTGSVEDACSTYNVPLKMLTMSDSKTFSTDKKLKVLGWYVKTDDGHANDAARLLLLFLVRYKILTENDKQKLKSLLT